MTEESQLIHLYKALSDLMVDQQVQPVKVMIQSPTLLIKGGSRQGRQSNLEPDEEKKQNEPEESMPPKYDLICKLYSSVENYIDMHSKDLEFEEMNVAESFQLTKRDLNLVSPHTSSRSLLSQTAPTEKTDG